MPKEYDYSTKYVEKDKNIKQRRCKNCKKMKLIKDLEVSNICDTCYPTLMGKKRCQRCEIRRPVEYFTKGIKKISTKDGYLNQCKMCVKDYRKANTDKIKKYDKEYAKKNSHKFRRYSSERRALKLKATIYPQLREEIDLIYKNCPEGYEVDHIIPLKNNIVCGLHVPWNLQYLTRAKNRNKKNKLL